MKIRSGFVSNSSSSSFCIYGTYIDDIEKYDLGKKLVDKKLTLDQLPYNDGAYIGRDPCTAKDEQTFKEWKEEIEKDIKEIFGEDANNFGWYQEAWYDG